MVVPYHGPPGVVPIKTVMVRAAALKSRRKEPVPLGPAPRGGQRKRMALGIVKAGTEHTHQRQSLKERRTRWYRCTPCILETCSRSRSPFRLQNGTTEYSGVLNCAAQLVERHTVEDDEVSRRIHDGYPRLGVGQESAIHRSADVDVRRDTK